MEWKFDMTTLSTWPHSLSQVSFVAPPKHEPVVIKLGEDLEKAGGDLFQLRLEMMIKEARKAAEVSRKPILWSALHTVVSSLYYRVIAWYKMFFSCVIQLYLHYFQTNMIENEHFDSHFYALQRVRQWKVLVNRFVP